METQIQTSSLVVLTAIFKVFSIIALGYWLKHKKIISEKTIDDLTRLVINVIIPCFLFVRVYREFSLTKIAETYQMALYAAGLMIFGALLAIITASLFHFSQIRRNSFIALTTFNNSGYLPIPLVYALLEKNIADQAAFYIAIFILIVSPFIWSWGVWLLSSKTREKSNLLKIIFTPPAIGILLGMSCAIKPFCIVVERLDFVVGAAYLLGEATIPLAMIIIGALLASTPLSQSLEVFNLLVLVLIKLIIMPAFVLIFIRLLNFPQIMGLVMLIQAAMPPAGNLAIIARNYGGDFGFISTAQIVTYILTAFTLPFFLNLY